MDKHSKKQLVDKTINVVQNAHLGILNDKDIDVQINIRQKKAYLPPNVMLFQKFAYLAATKLKPTTNRVLMLLFSYTQYENYIGMDVKTISEMLSMTERSVISALKELESNNIIVKVKHPSDKRRNDFFINPVAAWKGNSYTRNASIRVLKENKKQLNLFGTQEEE